MLDRLFQISIAGVIFAVGDHKENFFLEARVALQMVGRSHNRVVKRGPSAGVDLFQRFFQFQQVVGEVLVKVVFVIEVHDEHFVAGIARPYQIEHRLVHLGTLLAHRTGVVDDDAHRHRDILVMERDDALLLPVLKHGECGAIQVGHNVLLVVDHRGMKQNFVHVFLEDEDALIA